MAEEGAEPIGQLVEAEDVLGRSAEADAGESGDESGSETETESEGSETETESEEESGDESEEESESETESESESESGSSSPSKRPTAAGEGGEAQSQAELPPQAAGSSRPASASQQGTAEATDPEVSLQGLPSFVGSRPSSPVQQEQQVEQDGNERNEEGDEQAEGQPHQQLLPPVETSRPSSSQPAGSRSASTQYADALADDGASEHDERDGERGDEPEERQPHQQLLPPVETSRPSSSQPAGSRPASSQYAGSLAGDGASEQVPLTLPPATSRTSSRDCSRKGSHLDATSTGSVLGQSSDSLPPIKAISPSGGAGPSSQPSRKASMASSHATTKHSRAVSPRQGSPTRNPIAERRYWKPPPPPPPPPKPKPREKHDTSAVDPMFLQTAVYRTVPGVGRVYDWQLQHEVNAALSKQRKQQAQMDKVLEAARVQLQVREANERAFQQWVASKEQEKQQQRHQNRRIAYVTSVYTSLIKDDPVEHRMKESMWVGNFAYPTSDSIPARHMVRGNLVDSDERFRI